MFSESNQIKVLVADDNREFCGILKSYFTNDPDFQLIDVCTNGMEVINVLQKEEVEVLILDLIIILYKKIICNRIHNCISQVNITFDN
jgi:two-component system response regulator (stage 0 sporulation protein A)